jgi:RimJ/RimL family protein N-acetyltransferase
VFNQLGAKRLTVRTSRDNKRVIDIAVRFGFRAEGRLRNYYPNGSDAMIFGMPARRSSRNYLRSRELKSEGAEGAIVTQNRQCMLCLDAAAVR